MGGRVSGGVALNPIVVKSARARLRWKHLLSWGIVVATLTGFVSVIVYMVQVEQELATPAQAARWTLLPVIIIQAVVLMLLGTGAVASGISQERDEGLLDYQRMTPMSPSAKLLGYLFGLPVREYVLFALTLPFLAFAVVKGGFPLGTVAHFYAIFFSSVIVYHMTGMAAGMASSKPRRAGLIAQGMVLVLYFALPNLSHLGLTFFEFLTIRPALFGMINEEIERMGGGMAVVAGSRLTALDSFREIPFFGVHVHPSVYTLMVQGGLIVTLWTVVHRKWRAEGAHPFSKVFGGVFFAGACVFLMGSVWPIMRDSAVLAQLMGHFEGSARAAARVAAGGPEVTAYASMLLAVSAGVLGAAGILTLLCTTPTRHKVAEAWRRAVRLGEGRVGPARDGASSLGLCLACVAMAGGTLGVLAWAASGAGRFVETPPLAVLAAPVAYVGAILVFLQAALERFGRRAFFVSVFLLWMVPFFTAVLLGGAFELELGMAYVSLPFPPAGLAVMGMNILRSGAPGLDLSEGPTAILARLDELSMTAVALYVALAGVAVHASRRQHRRLREAALGEAVDVGGEAREPDAAGSALAAPAG